MSRRSPGKPTSTEQHWEGAGLGLDASTRWGPAYAAIGLAFPDATPFEYDCALTLPAYAGSWVRAEGAVARVRALREARPERLDLSEADWEHCVRVLYPTLLEQQRENPTEVLTAVAALRPPQHQKDVAQAPLVRRGSGRPGWTAELFLSNWHEAMSKAAPAHRQADIAAVFRCLDGAIGMTPDHLRRLRRRFST